MFKTYIAKPALVQAMQFQPELAAQLQQLFPDRIYTPSPSLGLCCRVGEALVKVEPGDWILYSYDAEKTLTVMSDACFSGSFMEPAVLVT